MHGYHKTSMRARSGSFAVYERRIVYVLSDASLSSRREAYLAAKVRVATSMRSVCLCVCVCVRVCMRAKCGHGCGEASG